MLGFVASNGNGDTVEGLRDTVAALQKRVKELEEGESDTVSSSRTPSLDETEELQTLRKQLAKVNDEKAKQELDFMNQLSSLAGENQGQIEELKSKLEQNEKENSDLQAQASAAETLKTNCIALDKQLQEFRNCHISEMKKVKDEHHSRMKEAQIKISELENEKASLLDEVSEVRVQLADEGKVASSVKSELQGLTGKHVVELEQLKADKASKDEMIERQQDELGEMNDNLIEMEGQKAQLLDEIMRLQKQIEKESKKASGFKAKIDDLNAQVCVGENQKAEHEAMEDWARSAEEKAERLETELLDVRDSLESELARLEFALDERTKEVEEKEEEISRANEAMKVEQQEAASMSSELKKQIETMEVELERFRDALHDESGKTDTIANELRRIIEQKQAEIDELQKSLEGEEQKTQSLSAEVQELLAKLTEELKVSAEKDAELVTVNTQREAYEKRTTQNIMEQVTEVDSLRAQNSALYEEVQNLNKRLESESDAAAKLMLELSDLRAANSKTTSSARSIFRSEQSPPTSPLTWRKPRTPSRMDSPPPSKTPSHMESPSRTPVRKMAAFFEKELNKGNICSSPNASFVVPDLSADDVDELQSKLENEQERVRVLEEKVQHDAVLVGELRAEMAALTATSSASQGVSWREFEKRNREDQEQIEALRAQVDDLQDQLDTERTLVKRLKAELCDVRSDGSISSNSSIEQRLGAKKAHPWKSSSQARQREAEVFSLKDSLASAQIANADMERDYLNKIKSLEDCIDVMEKEMESELKAREEEIDALQKKLDWHTEEISRLEIEREELCGNIDSLSSITKEEAEALRAQVTEKNTENAALAQEVNELKTKVEGSSGDRGDEVAYWKQKVRDIEERERKSTRARMNHVRSLDEMKAENEKLRSSVRDLTSDRKKIQEKMKSGRFDSSGGVSQDAYDKLRAKNSTMKKELERISRKSTRQGSSSMKPGGKSRVEI